VSHAEILALLNYESKSAEALKAFKSPVPGQTRQEGIAVIDVNPASPNFKKIVETIPLRRHGTTAEVADIIFFLCSQQASYVTGSEIHINGGQHV